LKAFLYKHLYRHAEVMRVRIDAEQIVRDLFDVYFADPRAMPDGWREGLDRAEDRIKARTVADFLAGMTDTYALKEHRRLFDHAGFGLGGSILPDNKPNLQSLQSQSNEHFRQFTAQITPSALD
jgi:hypothetical protein